MISVKNHHIIATVRVEKVLKMYIKPVQAFKKSKALLWQNVAALT